MSAAAVHDCPTIVARRVNPVWGIWEVKTFDDRRAARAWVAEASQGSVHVLPWRVDA